MPLDDPLKRSQKTRIRAGVTGHNVRYVLGFSLAGVIIAFLAIWIYFSFGRQPNDISVDSTPQSHDGQ